MSEKNQDQFEFSVSKIYDNHIIACPECQAWMNSSLFAVTFVTNSDEILLSMSCNRCDTLVSGPPGAYDQMRKEFAADNN